MMRGGAGGWCVRFARPRRVLVPADGAAYTADFSSLTAPTLADVGIGDKRFGFSMSGALNQTVVVEACTNLAAPLWVPLQTNTLGGSSAVFNASTTAPPSACYYRLRSQ